MKTTHIYKRTKQGAAIRADVYNRGKGSPVLLYFHGGGFIFGDRNWLPREQIDYFTQEGFSIISFDYRLAPETKLEQIVEDLKDALNWARHTAIPDYQFHPDKVAVIGSSAGAYLSLLAGTMAVKPLAVISLYGYGDIAGDWIASPSEHYRRKPIVAQADAYRAIGETEISEGPWARFQFYLFCRQHGVWLSEVTGFDAIQKPELLMQYCPLSTLNSQFPPTLLLHGDRDTDVPLEQSIAFHEKLKELGVPSKLIVIKNGEHVFDQDFANPQVKRAFEEIVLFLRERMD